MTQVVTISASTAATAFETLRIAPRVPASMVAKDARRIADRQLKGRSGQELNETASIIQSTEVALDLMTKGNKQPQAGLQQALKSYEDF
ncbi:hypothetical protein [Rhizobium sullae]|nr:hypothetical protein [Rhizobium sullae]PKA39068.1 hypothetical protein CWR43_34740 [Rhizobium sullae]UWU15927.1 hypothetical protein N2599_08010 [Rhizobium sullae]